VDRSLFGAMNLRAGSAKGIPSGKSCLPDFEILNHKC